MAVIRAKQEEQQKLFKRVANPYNADELIDTSMVEGKTVAQWEKLLDEAEAKVASLPPTKGVTILDLTKFPGWSCWAVRAWKARGAPTAASIREAQIKKLLAKAEDEDKWAGLAEQEAKGLPPEKAKETKRALAKAAKGREKALALRAEAETLAKMA